MLHFLKMLGAEPDQLEKAREEFGPPEEANSDSYQIVEVQWWMLTDEDVLQRIEHLVDTQFYSWVHHPYNKNDSISDVKSQSSQEMNFIDQDAVVVRI